MEAKLLTLASPLTFTPKFSMFANNKSHTYLCTSRVSKHSSILSMRASPTSYGFDPKYKEDARYLSILQEIRKSLIIREDNSIIYSLVKQPKYRRNASVNDEVQAKFLEFIVKEMEKAARRYHERPDNNAFFPNYLPEPLVPEVQFAQVLHSFSESININRAIWEMYTTNLAPKLVKEGDDGDYKKTAHYDFVCLMALSKRIHYGKLEAEVKFRASPEAYDASIRAQDKDTLRSLLKHTEGEDMKRVEELSEWTAENPRLIVHLYERWIMPMIRDVEVEYLLKRLDH